MKRSLKRLPEAELELMLCLWEAEGPVPRSYFDARLRDSRGWADSTVLSLLSRLEEKGFLKVEKRGNRNIYSPLVSRQAYLDLENRSFLARLHHDSLCDMVAGMAQAKALTRQDMDDLQELIDTLRRGEEK